MLQRTLRAEGLDAAESLLGECDSIITEVAERTHALQRFRHEHLFAELFRTNDALVHAVDLPSLQRILVQYLPRFDIRSCYLCLYETADGKVPSEYARAVLACSTERNIVLPESGLRFRASEILPAAFMQSEAQSTRLVCPLMREREDYNGYFVLERGTPEGYVYAGLLQQLGSAYERIELLSRVAPKVRLRDHAERERHEK